MIKNILNNGIKKIENDYLKKLKNTVKIIMIR